MALQHPNRLLIDGLSILADPRPNTAQPLVEDAVHLRWTFGRETAIPPYGYYLFRRGYPDVGEQCFGSAIARLRPGPVPTDELRTPHGTFTAPRLIATDDFEPAGAGELGLANGLTFTLPPNTITRRVFARIGFGETQHTLTTRSISFERMAEGTGPNPHVEQDVRFEVFNAPDGLARATRLRFLSGALGLDCGRQVVITLPAGTSRVQITLLRGGRAIQMTMKVFPREGSMFESPGIETSGSPLVDFNASSRVPIDRVVIDPPSEAVILRMTISSDAGSPEILLTGLAGRNVVASTTVRGAPRDIAAAELVGNGINTVTISAGIASLLDLCYSTCLSNYLAPLARGAVRNGTVQTPYGTLTGASMTAAEDFEPPGVAEISLANGGVRFALPEGVTTRRARVRLGFAPPHRDVRTEVGFRTRAPGDGPNRFEESGVRFDVQDGKGSASMRRLRETPGGVALECNRRLIITMPAGAINVHLLFRRRLEDPPSIVKMFTPDEKLAGEVPLATGEDISIGTQSNLVLRTFIIESRGDTLLYSISWSTQPKPAEVMITPFAGRRALRGITVRGAERQITTTEVTGDGITSLQITSGDASLIDICYAAETADGAVSAPGPWMFVPSFVYPLTLPITHPAYPASSGVEALETRRGPAGLRIRYGPVADSLPPPQRLPGAGTITLTPGSALAKGQGTAWNDSHVGMLLYPASTDTALAVMTVLAPDRLVLSRPFTGAQALLNAAYQIAAEDVFAQVHDQLGGLLSAAGGMRSATMPPVLDASAPGRKITLFEQTKVVQGTGTSWTADFVGLLLEVGSDVYRIVAVDPVQQQLTLHAPYAGGSGVAPYRIVSRSPHNRIEEGPSLAIPPLDLLELAALSPAYAQLLGLYWADRFAETGRTYDYIVIADHDGRFNRNAATALAYANGISDFSGTGADAAILNGITHSGSGALPAPASLRALALSAGRLATTLARPDLADSDPGLSITDLASWSSMPAASRPLMLDVWRFAHGTAMPAPGSPPAPATHTRVGDRVLPQLRTSDPSMPVPEGWPDPASIHYLDGDGGAGLDVGWYSYRVSAVDLWGRFSALSAPIPWHDAAGNLTAIHPHAVHLEDRIPPPPPTDLAAWVLEPENVPGQAPDPTLVKDAAYVAWRQTVGPNVRGLRLRWRWPWSHQLRAPDLQEFRVYAQSTPINARLHRVVSVVAAPGDPTRSEVTLAASDAQPANAYAGATLQVSKRAFPIEASSGGTHLVLRVRNGGPTGGEPPASGVDATIVLEAGHPLHRDLLDPLHWKPFLGPVAQKPPSVASIRYDVDPLEDPSVRLFDDPQNSLHGVVADWDGVRVRIDDLPSPAITGVRPGIDVIAVGQDDTGRFAILEIALVDPVLRLVHPVMPAPGWLDSGAYRWAIGPLTQDLRGTGAEWNAGLSRLELAGQPDLSRVRPGIDLIYVEVGSTSTPENLQQFFDIERVDTALHRLILRGALDSLANGSKYEWRIGKPVRVYEVFLPSAAAGTDDPQLDQWLEPSLAEPVVYATVGVSGADKRTERPDLRPGRTPARPGNEGLLAGPATIFRVQREIPAAPADDVWEASRLWATRADYHGDSYFTVRWKKPPAPKLPFYKALVFRAMDETLYDVDLHLDPPRAFPLTQTMLDGATPAHWSPARKAAVAGEFIGATSTYETIRAAADFPAAQLLYRTLTDDAYSVLANLPGNDEAFSQISITALDLTDPGSEDRRGPDDELATFPGVNITLNATLDRLDGRSQNRYLYKIAFVDPANNRGSHGKASPAVYLPKIVRPRAPVITTVLGGERQIGLWWSKNRETDLLAYRVYRADDAASARDIRLMLPVHDVLVSDLDPNAANVNWSDSPVSAGRDFHYCVTALDSATPPNESIPSVVVVARAVDTVPPATPVWVSAEWVLYDPDTTTVQPWPASGVIPPPYKAATRLELKGEAPLLTIYRRVHDSKAWQVVGLPDTPISVDPVVFDLDVIVGQKLHYRAIASNQVGTTSQYSQVIPVKATP